MTSEISMRNAAAEMAYVGETPWHGLGNKLEAGASIDTWRVAAGMDWTIARTRVRFPNGTPNMGIMDSHHVLVRSDNKFPLAVVSAKYKTVQPAEVLEFFRDLTERAGFVLETAGVLFDGRRFWALAKTGQSESIADPQDRVANYLLLSTSCDGTMPTEGRYTTVRVVCNNTLTSARQKAAKVRVTHRSHFKADEVKRELGIDLAAEQFSETMADMRRLADVRLLDADSMLQTAELLKPGAASLAREDLMKILDSKPVKRISELAIDGAARGARLDGVSGTQWGWLNAVTEYVDHEARARSTNNRLSSAWFGPGAALKERAYEMAVNAVDGTPITTSVLRAEHGVDQTTLLDDVLAATTV
jgi:phage/plasmid-like protein (TIGR03299 family)